MTARVVVASVVIHSAVVVVILLLASTRVRRPPTVDIELVAPALLALGPPPVPPPPDRGGDAGQRGDRIPDRAPARRAEPVRKLPRAPRVAPPAPSSAAVEPAAPDPEAPAPAAPAGAAAGASEPAGGDDLESGGGGGEGVGGDGDGGVIDLSSRPVPLEIKASQTLPYTAEAQRDRVSGDVQLMLAVDPLGRVERTTIRHGLGHGLDEIATRLAMQIRFRPARDRAGKPTAGTVRWKFHFQPP